MPELKSQSQKARMSQNQMIRAREPENQSESIARARVKSLSQKARVSQELEPELKTARARKRE